MRVLIVVHGFPPLAGGGSEIHAWDLARELSHGSGDDVLVLTREADATRPEHTVREEVRDGVRIVWINHTFRAIRAFSDNYDDDRITRVAESAIDAFAPDVAHIHHLTCLSTGLVRSLKRRQVPVVMTLHDYWLLCHRGQLLDIEGEVCAGPGGDGCRRCLGPVAELPSWVFTARRRSARFASMLPSSMKCALERLTAGTRSHSRAGRGDPIPPHLDEASRRYRHMRTLASDLDAVLVPSRFLLERFVEAGFSADRCRLAPYGVDHRRFARAQIDRPREPGGPLRLGYLGSLILSKGAHVLFEAVARLPPRRVTIEVFGAPAAYHGDTSYGRRLAPLLSAPGVRVHGHVPHDRVRAAFAEMDVLVVPSIWPENSPLVIREAFACGVPVVASHVGGIPETIRDGVGGLLFPVGDAGALAMILTGLGDRPGLLRELARSIPPVPSLADEAHALREVLQSLVPATAGVPRPAASTGRAPEAPPLLASTSTAGATAIIVNYRAWNETVLAVRSLRASDRLCDRIIVVDNDSAGGPPRDVLAAWPLPIEYVPMSGNVGFPAGVNEGLTRALDSGAGRVLLLNSDALVRPDCIGEMERIMDECQAGIVGPVVLSRENPDILSTAGIAFDERTGRMTQPGSGAPFDVGQYPAACSVESVSACAMLIDRAVIERIGLFDPEYFFGFEDIDFCLRARTAGFRVVVAARAVAYHQGSQSMGETSADRFYFAARNHLRLAQRVNPESGAGRSALRSSVIVGLNLAHAVRARGGTRWGRLAAVVRGTRDAARHRYGPKPS